MRLHIPSIAPILVIGDDARLLAQISAVFARKNTYFPLLDSPRLQRPDAEAEVLRRNNVAARLLPKRIILAGLDASTCNRFSKLFPSKITSRISTIADLATVPEAPSLHGPETLRWGPKGIGLGLLRALRARQHIAFEQMEVPLDAVQSRSGHLVVCEDGDDLAQVIAANYAFALNAGLCLIPAVEDEEARAILEEFYTLSGVRDESPTGRLQRLMDRMRVLAGSIPLSEGGSVSFITRQLPWGVAFPEVPATHLFSYPDLGISIANGLVAEQPGSPGIRVAALIDPGMVDAKEIRTTVDALRSRGVFLRGLHAGGATVGRASRMIELFPYDLLLISTHCGDVQGWRWTYEFVDSEGLARVLVVDVAAGFAHVPGTEKLSVTEFTRFVSLDGVDWNDPVTKGALYVGRAILDYSERSADFESFKPTKREIIPRVVGSAALAMHDGNYIPVPHSLAWDNLPIVICNACASWHRLAQTFTFGNARVYIGTLYDVLDSEAQGIIGELVERQVGKPLAVALWHAQRKVSGNGLRRPYVMVGCHFQRLRATVADVPDQILRKLDRARQTYERDLARCPAEDSDRRNSIQDRLRYMQSEIAGIRDRWINVEGISSS